MIDMVVFFIKILSKEVKNQNKSAIQRKILVSPEVKKSKQDN